MRRYPFIDGDPEPSHKEREVWRRQRALWAASEDALINPLGDEPMSASVAHRLRSAIAEQMGFAQPAPVDDCPASCNAPPKPGDAFPDWLFDEGQCDEPETNEHDPHRYWNRTLLSREERIEELYSRATTFYQWAKKLDPSDEVCCGSRLFV